MFRYNKNMSSNDSVEILKALADDARLSIVKKLASEQGPIASCTLVESCSSLHALSQPTVSHHFARLVDAQVVLQSKQGTQNVYQLNRELLDTIGLDITKL